MNPKILKSSLTFISSFVLTGVAYGSSPSPIIFSDSFEPALPFVRTACGFYDKDTKLTWSTKSYDCGTDNDTVCTDKAIAMLKQDNAKCEGKLPTLAQLIGIVDKTKSPKSKIPNAKTDGVTIAVPTANPLTPNEPPKRVGIDFKTGEVKAYTNANKRYARLVLMSS